MYYDEITRLLDKYSQKQPGERWSKKSERRKERIVEYERKVRLFDGINSEYFQLKGSQKERVKHLIKKLNFNEICPRCSSEQIIVLICYFVNCEYNKRYRREYCRKVFNEYNISDNLHDRFLIYLARYGISNTILDKNMVLNTQYIVRE